MASDALFNSTTSVLCSVDFSGISDSNHVYNSTANSLFILVTLGENFNVDSDQRMLQYSLPSLALFSTNSASFKAVWVF